MGETKKGNKDLTEDAFLLSEPRFKFEVRDNAYKRIGIHAGDSIIFSGDLKGKRILAAEWDDMVHICTRLADGTLFDERNVSLAPDGAKIIGGGGMD